MKNQLKQWFLVHDDDDEVEFFRVALKDAGLPVHIKWISSCSDLFYELQSQMPDLLLIDSMLPMQNGVECLIKLKQQENLFELPVVILSNQHHESYKLQSYRSGAFRFVVKPSKFDNYTAMVKSLFELTYQSKHIALQNFEMNFAEPVTSE